MKKIHFIAIGGSIMHYLAINLRNKGYYVTGSDDEIFEPAKSNLAKYNILPIKTGWYPDKINDKLDGVIVGMHAKADNPELKKAIKLKLKIYSFPQYIFEQTKNKKRVVIGGSHGKTTITSMIMHVLTNMNFDYDYMVGADLEGFNTMVKLSEAPIAILEGDEYLSSVLELTPKFHFYKPHIALLSGIAWDHINVFPTFESYQKSFETFVNLIEKEGTLIYNNEDKIVEKIALASKSNLTLIPYQTPDMTIEGDIFYLHHKGQQIPLRIFGQHNLQNIQGALAVCKELGVSEEQFLQNIQSFKGSSKRLELISSNNSTSVFRDFAHAPSKLRASIHALKNLHPKRYLVVCMELHTYSSLNKAFLHHYKDSMNKADTAIIYYNPHTIELKQLAQISDEDISGAFNHKNIKIFTSQEEMIEYLHSIKWEKTNLALMSSGNFGGIDMDELITFVLNK